jgi:hypothetical protein
LIVHVIRMYCMSQCPIKTFHHRCLLGFETNLIVNVLESRFGQIKKFYYQSYIKQRGKDKLGFFIFNTLNPFHLTLTTSHL